MSRYDDIKHSLGAKAEREREEHRERIEQTEALRREALGKEIQTRG